MRKPAQKKTLPFGDVFFELVALLTKKDIAFRRCLLLGARWDYLQKKTLPFGDVFFGVGGITHKKRHCFSAMSSFGWWDFSQKKTLPFGDVFFWVV